MGKNFKNINEELERMKTLMYETDNLILNKEKLNESMDDESKEDESMDEQATPPVAGSTTKTTPDAKPTPKSFSSSFKVAKVSDINTLVRGGAAKFDTFKIKGTGATQLFDEKGEITKDGMELAKKSLSQIGVSLKPGEVLMRIGKKDSSDKDKVFFQIVPTTELSVVTQDNQVKNLDPSQLEKLPVASVGEKKSEEKKGAETTKTDTTTQPPAPTTSTDKLIGVKLSTTKLNVMDITDNAKASGYKLGQYFINKDTKDVYRVQDGIITAVFKRGAGQPSTPKSESFNMDLIFVNPLLFESVITEQETVTLDKYTCVGDCRGQSQMSDKFTKFADDSLSGKKTEPTPSPDPSPSPSTSGWDNFPCITKNSAIKKIDDPKMGVVYQDAANRYFSNGRFMDLKTKKIGNYKCDGDKIVSDKEQGKKEESSKKPMVVTDADLMGETGLLQNVLRSPWFIASIIPVLTLIEIGTAGAATPLVAAAAGGSGAFASAIDRTNRRAGVKGVVDALDGWVDEEDLGWVFSVISSLNNKFYYDDSLETPQYITATQAFLDLYEEDEGSSLISDVEGIGTNTLKTGSEKVKKRIISTINRQLSQPIPAELAKQTGSGTESGESI